MYKGGVRNKIGGKAKRGIGVKKGKLFLCCFPIFNKGLNESKKTEEI